MREAVLFVVEGFQHLEPAKVFARLLRSEGTPTALYYPHAIEADRLEEFTHTVKDLRAIPGFLRQVKLVVTFTNETSPACMHSNLISYVARKLNTAVATIQHGWLQPGLNFESELPGVGFDRGADNSLAVAHFGRQIEWEGETGIGYYAYGHDAKIISPKPRQDRYSVLLCTNFNSTLYSREQGFQFLRCISRLKETLPYVRLYHRGHPAEHSGAEFKNLGMLELTRHITPAVRSPQPMAAALVGMDFAITLPSTTALDCVAHGVPVFVFEEKNFIGKMEAFGGSLFRTHTQLIDLTIALLSSGKYQEPAIKRFSPQRFLAVVDELSAGTGHYQMTEEIMFNYYGMKKNMSW